MPGAPAFQFYANDFMRGTAEMTAAAVGVYIRALCHQWDHGSIPSDPQKAARAISIEAPQVWDEILPKFELGEDGRLRNKKLETIRQEQESYRLARSNAGQKGAKSRWQGNGTANGSSNGTANGKPHGKTMALQSSSSSSSSTSTPVETLMSGKPDVSRQIIEHLNQKTGKRFRCVESNLRMVRARLREYTEAELMAVVDRKVAEWGQDAKMQPYLRPATLFGAEKCAQYVGELNQPLRATHETNRRVSEDKRSRGQRNADILDDIARASIERETGGTLDRAPDEGHAGEVWTPVVVVAGRRGEGGGG